MSHVELTTRLMCSESGVNSRRIRSGKLDNSDRAKLAEVSNTVAQMNLHTHDQPQLTVYDIRRAARRLVKGELDLVVVDYLQLLKPDNPRDPVHEQLGAMTRQLKILARELDVPVVVLCQLNREADKGQARLSHLKGSGAIEQDADVVMILDRPGTGADKGNATGEATLVVEKNRNGSPGAYKLEWIGARTRYVGSNEQQPHGDFDGFE
jgi:replicative DNA helicase